MKKKTIALIIGMLASGVSGGLIFSGIFAGLTTALVLTGLALLAVSAVLIGIGCYQLWKNWIKKQGASSKIVLNEFPLNSSKKYLLPVLHKDALRFAIIKFLNTTDALAFTSANKDMHRFLRPHQMLAPLLRSVVNGNQERVTQILGRHPELAVLQGSVMDNSERTFPRASAAELVRWCGDLRYMANAMLDVLSRLSDQKLAERIRLLWVRQNETYEQEGGLVYVLPGKTEPEKPSLAFSLSPLLLEMKAYVDKFNTMTSLQRGEHWHRIAAEQFLLPAIYLQHYCNPKVPFYPTPSFEESRGFPRVLTIYHSMTGKKQGMWDGRDSGFFLGRDFGITTGCMPSHVLAGGAAASPHYVSVDWKALVVCEERTRLDLLLFRERLNKPLNQQMQAESKPSCFWKTLWEQCRSRPACHAKSDYCDNQTL